MQPSAARGKTADSVANHASRVGPADACFLDCVGAAWQPRTAAPMFRRGARCVCGAACSGSSARRRASTGSLDRGRCSASGSSAAARRQRLRAAPTLARPRRCSGLARDDETSGGRPNRQWGAPRPHCSRSGSVEALHPDRPESDGFRRSGTGGLTARVRCRGLFDPGVSFLPASVLAFVREHRRRRAV